MAVTVTNTTITALNTEQTWGSSANAATSTVAETAEVFTITPTKKGSKLLLFFRNDSTGSDTVSYSIAAGTQWAAKAITGTIAAGAIEVLQLDDARVKGASGAIAVTCTPSTGASLKTTIGFDLHVVELL